VADETGALFGLGHTAPSYHGRAGAASAPRAACANLGLDPLHCGACGNACSGDQHCGNGGCFSCGQGETYCLEQSPNGIFGTCANFATDNLNCGRCQNRSATGQQTCVNGTCQ
jgi:hypothetical protein